MKQKTLSKISKRKYRVEDNCIYKGNKKICNFYIKNLCINYHLDRAISFTIELKSDAKKKEATFPMCYMNNPSGWLYYGFDSYDFYSIVGKNEFDRTINEIIGMMKNRGECTNIDEEMGWRFRGVNTKNLRKEDVTVFSDFDDLSDVFYREDKRRPLDYIQKYAKFADENISNVLFSYLLLALLSSFDLLDYNIRLNFAIALTGGNEFIRRKVALFFTNVFERNLAFGKNDYNMTHIMSSDSFAEIRFKTEFVKDCVLIALEPDKKHLNYLINDIYSKRVMDENHPVRNMCLITTEKLEKVNGNIINIRLPEEYDFEKMDEYFDADNPATSKEDSLMDSIYYYLNLLMGKLATNTVYVNEKFYEYINDDYTPGYFAPVPETGEEAAVLLSFAYWLYMSEYHENADEKTKDDIEFSMWGIYNAVEKAFLSNGESENTEIEKVKSLCSVIDAFFTNSKNKKRLMRIGEPWVSDDIRMWYDDECLYIKADNIKEMLSWRRKKETFGIKIKVILAENKLIKTYTKKDGKPEYSIHIQRNLFAEPENSKGDEIKINKKTQARYIAFDRKRCRSYGLFENIETAIIEKDKEIEKKKL